MTAPEDSAPESAAPAPGWRAEGRRTALLAALLVAAVFAYYAATWRSFSGFVGGLDDTPLFFADFIRHYYPTAKEVLASGTPSAGFFYPACFAVVLVPFGFVPLPASIWLWGCSQVLTAGLLLGLAGRYLRRFGPGVSLLHLLLFLISLPVLSNFKWGQVSALVFLCGLASLHSYSAGRRVGAGIFLALGTALKYYPGLFAIYFLLKRDLRTLVSFALALAVFAIGLPWATLGPGRSEHFRHTVNERMQAARPGLWRDINSQYFASVLYRQTPRGAKEMSPLQEATVRTPQERQEALRRQMAGPQRPGPAWPALRVLGYVLFAGQVLLLFFVLRWRTPDELPLAFVFLFASIPLVVETSWPHYFVFLPFCQATVYALLQRAPRRARRAGLALLVPSMVLSSAVFFQVLGDWRQYSRWGVLLLADGLLLLAADVHLRALRLGHKAATSA
jgi:hypothetical protein